MEGAELVDSSYETQTNARAPRTTYYMAARARRAHETEEKVMTDSSTRRRSRETHWTTWRQRLTPTLSHMALRTPRSSTSDGSWHRTRGGWFPRSRRRPPRPGASGPDADRGGAKREVPQGRSWLGAHDPAPRLPGTYPTPTPPSDEGPNDPQEKPSGTLMKGRNGVPAPCPSSKFGRFLLLNEVQPQSTYSTAP